MKTCSAKDCPNLPQAKGYCDKHYRRFKKYGNPEIVYSFVPKECLHSTCKRQSKSKNYCDKHYRRFIKTGTTDLIKDTKRCSVEGCKEKHLAKNLCYTHYNLKTQNILIDDNAKNIIKSHDKTCDICKTDTPGFGRKNFCIDHDHNTGIVRGILCQQCNIGLGNFQDNPEILQAAIKYLTKK